MANSAFTRASLDTPVSLLDGGTGAALTDPGADRILFWDDSAGAVTWLTAGNGLTITTTTIAVDTASDIVDGIVELATDAETVTGTDTARAVTPANLTARLAAPGAIGGTTPANITGLIVTANTGFAPDANDGAYLGQAGTAFSDLFLAEGGVINWDSGDLTLTQTGNELALAGGNLDIGTNTLRIAGDIDVDGTPASDDTWTGPSTNDFNAGATVAQWEAVYLDSSSTWQLTDADAASTAGSVMIALAAEAGSSASPMRVLLPGSFARNDAWNWTIGGTIYLSTTPGALTQTAPSATDDVIRICGWAVTADIIFWNPSPEYTTHV